MTNKEVYDLLCKRLGNRVAVTTRSVVISELNKMIEELETRATLPWFLETDWDATTTPPAIMVAQQEYLELPPDFLREMEEGVFEIQEYPETTWTNLKKVSYEVLREKTRNCEPQIPTCYALRGTRIYFGPTPDVTYVFRLPYIKKSGEVLDNTSTISNPWLTTFFNFVTLEVISMVANTHTKDYNLVKQISTRLAEVRSQYNVAVEARRMANEEPLLTNEES